MMKRISCQLHDPLIFALDDANGTMIEVRLVGGKPYAEGMFRPISTAQERAAKRSYKAVMSACKRA